MRYLKQTNYLMWAVNAAVCIGLGFACVSWYSLVSKANSGNETRVEFPAVLSGSNQNSAPVSVDTEGILKSRLFKSSELPVVHDPEALAAEAKARANKAAKIDMPLRLVGTIVGDQANSIAIIEEIKEKRQGVYKRGDILLEARIEDIRQNQVVLLLAGGVRYVLDSSISDSGSQQPVKPIGAEKPVEESVRLDEVVRKISTSEVMINAQARNVAKRQLSRVMDKVSLRTVSDKGKKPGVRITGLPDSLLGRMIGLNNGDVIHKINGHPVENARKASQVLKKARKVGSAEVQFSRGDKERTLMLQTGLW
jgi:type II secretory pathway component PulC